MPLWQVLGMQLRAETDSLHHSHSLLVSAGADNQITRVCDVELATAESVLKERTTILGKRVIGI